MLDWLASVVLFVSAGPAVLGCGYLAALTLLSRRTIPAVLPTSGRRFDLVVPAHDEEAGIAATVHSLQGLDWPADQRRIVVVADNCTDATAERARQAGATVLVRQDAQHRGKGYALSHAYAWVLADGRADAVVVVDADTLVSPNLLRAFSARLDAGAEAAQARYGVQNPGASWRTRLMAIAFSLVHDLRSLARERLGVSVGLRGNGMCFTTGLLRAVPHRAFSIVEDLEHGLRIGLVGHRVHYAGEASVLGEMPSGGAASASQRQRWESGRRAMVRAHAWPLLKRGLATRDRLLIDLALDLLVPPLSWLAALALAGSIAAAALALVAGTIPAGAWLWWSCLPALGLYVARGWWISGTGLAGLGSLAWAPVYVVWKVALLLKAGPGARWVRTPREPSR